ncbi:competence type IV pilus minor pilin ComGD [Halobacillus sp. ACCC02827]|uniref:competence type IV pilus minor pilin ComGD n=1 Tax=Bacillaceae TaxID=186817 RepID=UPI0002A4F643|nr:MULTISPECIES: competence type IV pilus minor pilin ComGD [Bacillaceae]ELK46231.1 ComG operon protein 4 [Halobacillus sp. BAB-2008]QHT47151.1 competence protein ComG [Bacillus sp. SB49]WJE14378.1 competence type IV pilus minor pilin ComGD [Halobacillus sp. ACCC02827]
MPLPNSQSGYTFTETVLVLLSWSILLLCIAPLHHHTLHHVQEKLFLQQFQEDVLLSQQLTQYKHPYFTLYFYETNNQYALYDSKEKRMVFQRTLPADWRINMLTLKPQVKFNQRGIIQSPGTMKFTSRDTSYKVTFPFGTSRVRIDEE